MGKRTLTAGLLVCAALVACNLGTSEDDTASGESNNTEARQPLLAPTWTKCWVEKDTSTNDPFFQAHSVKCRFDLPGAKQPIKPKYMTVEVHDAQGNAGVKRLEETPGQDVVVHRVRNDYFPLKVYAHVSSEDFEAVGLERASLIDARLPIANVDAATKERPLEIKQPFDLWPVSIIQKHSFFYLQLDRRPISIAPFVFGQSENAPSDGFASGTAMGRELGSNKTFYFIAPKQGGLAGKYHGDADVPGVRIDAPGYYVAGANEFRKATEEEASGASPAQPAELDASSEAAPPEPIVSEAGAPETGPPRDCGVAGKKCCGGSNGFGGTCDPGAYCPSNENMCQACGGPGQKCCGGFGGTCNAGAYCPSNENMCQACGGPGQKCCGGFGGSCNAGSYCPSNQNQCEACGKLGQKCCGGFGGTCESGGRCQTNGNTCIAN